MYNILAESLDSIIYNKVSDWWDCQPGQAKPTLNLRVPKEAGLPAVPLPREHSSPDLQVGFRSTPDFLEVTCLDDYLTFFCLYPIFLNI